MNDNEREIEFLIKNKILNINPNRKLFEDTMNSVTKEDLKRNTIMKKEVSSFNKTSYMINKKIVYIGLPILALATYLVFVNVDTSKEGLMVVNPRVAKEETVVEGSIKVAEIETTEVTKDSSVDEIVTGILADIENDSTFAINDVTDSEFINLELNNYSSINQNGYEEII